MRGMGRQKLGSLFIAITFPLALASGVLILFLTDIGIIGESDEYVKNKHKTYFMTHLNVKCVTLICL